MKSPDFNDIHRTHGAKAARNAFDTAWSNSNGS